MKVLIETDRFNTIDADVILSIDDSGYRIKIKGIGSAIQLVQATQLQGSSPPTGDRNANHGVLGFEDLDDEVGRADYVEFSNWKGEAIVENEKARDVVIEPPKIQSFSNLAIEDRRVVDSPTTSNQPITLILELQRFVSAIMGILRK